MTAHVLMLLKLHALPDMLRFSLCNKKRLAIQHMNRPLFPTLIDSILQHWELGRAKDLTASPHGRIPLICHRWYQTSAAPSNSICKTRHLKGIIFPCSVH